MNKEQVLEKIKNHDSFNNQELSMLQSVISELSEEQIFALIPLGGSSIISEKIETITENHPHISHSALALAMLEKHNNYGLVTHIMKFKNLSLTVAKKLVEFGNVEILLFVIDRNPDVFPDLTKDKINDIIKEVNAQKKDSNDDENILS